MTDQEIIYKAIREVVNTDNPVEFAAHNSTCYTIAKYVCEELREKLNSLPTEQPSEDLEKAATALTNEIVGELNLGDYTDHSGHNAHWHSFKEGVVAGAQWQKEKIINKASQWLNENVVEYHPRKGELRPVVNINAFREAMEMEDEQ